MTGSTPRTCAATCTRRYTVTRRPPFAAKADRGSWTRSRPRLRRCGTRATSRLRGRRRAARHWWHGRMGRRAAIRGRLTWAACVPASPTWPAGDAEAASAGRVSRSLDGLASAAGAAGRARTCREHAELRRALNANGGGLMPERWIAEAEQLTPVRRAGHHVRRRSAAGNPATSPSLGWGVRCDAPGPDGQAGRTPPAV